MCWRKSLSPTCPWLLFVSCSLHSSCKTCSRVFSSGVRGGSVVCFLVLFLFFYYFFFFTLLVQKRLSFTFWRVALIAQYSAFSLPLFHTVTILSVLLKVMFLCSTLWFHGLGVRNVLLLRKGNMTNCDCWIFPAPYYNKHYYNNNAVVNELMRVLKKEPLDSSSLTSVMFSEFQS